MIKTQKKRYQIGRYQETGLMYANAASPALVHLLRLQLMVTVMAYWYGTYRKDSIVILYLMV